MNCSDFEEMLLAYANKDLPHTKENRRFLEPFKTGYCSGISSLWLYSKWLQTQPKSYNNDEAAKVIGAWAGKKDIKEKDIRMLNSIISK